MHKKLKTSISFLSMLAVLLLAACEQPYSPKPRGFFRIDLPEKEYQVSDSSFPYIFEYPSYTTMGNDPKAPAEKYWVNVDFPAFNATLHLSYKDVSNNLFTYLEDSYTLVSKHIPKADAITDNIIFDPDRKVFGLTYRIEGSGAASPYQFFVTDSTVHFLRGALYFNTTPNNDSLAPVIDFIIDDIQHLINTLHWNGDLQTKN